MPRYHKMGLHVLAVKTAFLMRHNFQLPWSTDSLFLGFAKLYIIFMGRNSSLQKHFLIWFNKKVH